MNSFNFQKINLSKIENEKIIYACSELTKTLNIRLDNNGKTLLAVKGNENTVETTVDSIKIVYSSLNYLYRGIALAVCGIESVKEKCIFTDLGIMLDCSRNAVLNIENAKKLIRLLAIMGYSSVQLYTEDTYEIEGEPRFGYLRGRFSKEQLKELNYYASCFGIELIPCIQTLAHLNSIFRWTEYADIHDIDDVLMADEPKTYDLIEKMFKTISECFYSRRVNIGMDEAFRLGRGKHQDKYGTQERTQIMLRHVNKVNEIAQKYGFTCMMWSDMFMRTAMASYSLSAKISQEIKNTIPNNISLVYWDYYSSQVSHYDEIFNLHKQINNEIVFAGGAWNWTGHIPNNSFSIRACTSAITSCLKNDIKRMFLTLWGDDGAEGSFYSLLPTLVNVAEQAYGNSDMEKIKQAFLRVSNISYDNFMAVDLLNKFEERHKDILTNPSKYYLFTDCFTDLFLNDISSEYKTNLLKAFEMLKKSEKDKEYGYLFKLFKILAQILYIKYDLSIDTRSAYNSNNKYQIKKLIKQRYIPLVKLIKKFHEANYVRWHKENKPHGFEILDYRLGGLVYRIKYYVKTLQQFVKGKITNIELLEEEILDFERDKSDYRNAYYFNSFVKTASVNAFFFE